MDQLPVIPFGKYKGQPVTKLFEDQKYLEWLMSQTFFQQSPIYNIVIAGASPNSDQPTPEHNRLQIKFLNKDFQQMVNDHICFCLDLDEYPKSCTVEPEGPYGCDIIMRNKMLETYREYDFWIELKPSMGDDFPCVMRKMKQQRELVNAKFGCCERRFFVLIVDNFSSTAATREELKEFFLLSKIYLIFYNKINEHRDKVMAELERSLTKNAKDRFYRFCVSQISDILLKPSNREWIIDLGEILLKMAEDSILSQDFPYHEWFDEKYGEFKTDNPIIYKFISPTQFLTVNDIVVSRDHIRDIYIKDGVIDENFWLKHFGTTKISDKLELVPSPSHELYRINR